MFLLVHVLWKIVSNHSELIFSRLFIFYEALTTLQSWRVSACLTFLQTETTWHFCMLFSNCHFFVLSLGLIPVYDGLSRTTHSMWNSYKPWIHKPKRCYFILSPLSLSWEFHSSIQNLTDFFKELSIGLFRLHSQAGITHLDLDIVSKQCAFSTCHPFAFMNTEFYLLFYCPVTRYSLVSQQYGCTGSKVTNTHSVIFEYHELLYH